MNLHFDQTDKTITVDGDIAVIKCTDEEWKNINDHMKVGDQFEVWRWVTRKLKGVIA